MQSIHKYPRTRHLIGSRLQTGDEDLDAAPFSEIQHKNLVIEEKVDGANAAISFDETGRLLLQSRGHYLTGGSRERHFNLFKQWAQSLAAQLWQTLSHRYILYGEWLYAKHTLFYDRLPHYFMEFDLLDLQTSQFLSTPRRREVLAPLNIPAVRVLHEGAIRSTKELTCHIGPSAFISDRHIEKLRQHCSALNLDADTTLRQTDPGNTMEGLYIKVEEVGAVTERYKFIRPTFLQTVIQSETHWLARPIIPNLLAPGATLFQT